MSARRRERGGEARGKGRAVVDREGDLRFRPEDDCPLFSPALEEHLVAVSRGESPARGRFCGHCYTPVGGSSRQCPHCGEDFTTGRRAVDAVPAAITEALRMQRKIEARWVNGLAYVGVLLAIVGGIAFVLWAPVLRESLIYATIVYGLILLVGGRVLAGILGGYVGDHVGYARARARTRATWYEWLAVRDDPPRE